MTETPVEPRTVVNNQQQVAVTATNSTTAAQPVQKPAAVVVNSKPAAVGVISPTQTVTIAAAPPTTQGDSGSAKARTNAGSDMAAATVADVADDEDKDEYVSKFTVYY